MFNKIIRTSLLTQNTFIITLLETSTKRPGHHPAPNSCPRRGFSQSRRSRYPSSSFRRGATSAAAAAVACMDGSRCSSVRSCGWRWQSQYNARHPFSWTPLCVAWSCSAAITTCPTATKGKKTKAAGGRSRSRQHSAFAASDVASALAPRQGGRTAGQNPVLSPLWCLDLLPVLTRFPVQVRVRST